MGHQLGQAYGMQQTGRYTARKSLAHAGNYGDTGPESVASGGVGRYKAGYRAASLRGRGGQGAAAKEYCEHTKRAGSTPSITAAFANSTEPLR